MWKKAKVDLVESRRRARERVAIERTKHSEVDDRNRCLRSSSSKRYQNIDLNEVVRRAQDRVKARAEALIAAKEEEEKKQQNERKCTVDVREMARIAEERSKAYAQKHSSPVSPTRDLRSQRMQEKKMREQMKEMAIQRRAEIYALNQIMMAWNFRKMNEYRMAMIAPAPLASSSSSSSSSSSPASGVSGVDIAKKEKGNGT
eukprot:g1966.t1